MADSYGLAMGALEGLNRGLLSFAQARQARDEKAADMAAKGLIQDPNGNWMPDPAALARERRKRISEGTINLLGKGYKVQPSNFDEEGFLSGTPEVNQEYFKAKTETDPLHAITALLKKKELEDAETKKNNAREQEIKGAGLVVQDVGRARNLIKDNDWASGPFAGRTQIIPGTPANQLKAYLDSVKANIGFDKLQAMRAASPTGGALGNVSDKETAMLQQTAGKLDPAMPTDQLNDNLARLYNQYMDVIHGPGKGPKRIPLSFDDLGNPVMAKKEKKLRPGDLGTMIQPSAEADESAEGPYGPTTDQNGHTYIWNPATKKYE